MPENQCPVCRARFRAVRVCSRCGADLEPVMILAAKAWILRRSARQALTAGEFAHAFLLARRAQQLQWTPGGQELVLLSAWLSPRPPAIVPN